MSETKVEHARLLNEESDKTKFSYRNAIFLSTNSTPRLSRMPSCRSTISTSRDIIEEFKGPGSQKSESRGKVPSIKGLDKLSDSTKIEQHSLDYELLSIRSEEKDVDFTKQESVDSTMLSTQNDQLNQSSSFLQIPLLTEGGVSPRIGKTSLFRSTSKLPVHQNSPKTKEMSSPKNYPEIKLSSLFLKDMKKIISYSPSFNRSLSKMSGSDKSCISKVSHCSQLPRIKKRKELSSPQLHKRRMKKLIKIAQLCNLNINVLNEEVLRYEGEKSSIRLANYLEKEIRKRANLFSSQVRVQMHNLDKLKREWEAKEFEDSDSEVSKVSTFSSTSWDSESSSRSSSKSRLFTY